MHRQLTVKYHELLRTSGSEVLLGYVSTMLIEGSSQLVLDSQLRPSSPIYKCLLSMSSPRCHTYPPTYTSPTLCTQTHLCAHLDHPRSSLGATASCRCCSYTSRPYIFGHSTGGGGLVSLLLLDVSCARVLERDEGEFSEGQRESRAGS